MPAFIADCFQGLQLRQPEPLIQVRMDPGLLVFMINSEPTTRMSQQKVRHKTGNICSIFYCPVWVSMYELQPQFLI